MDYFIFRHAIFNGSPKGGIRGFALLLRRLKSLATHKMQKLMKQKKRLVIKWSLTLCMAWVSWALYAQDNPPKPKMGEPSKLKISGWAQVQYQSVWQDGKAVTESFRIRRARLSADGQLHPMLTYKLQADFGNSPALVDAYLKLRFCDAFSLQAGQFKTPFTIESGISPMNLEYIDYGEPIQKLAGYSDICGIGRQGRDIGLMAIGRLFAVDGREKPFHLLHYSLGVFNGNGINKMDDDKRKDFVARLMIYPMKELNLSGYYQRSLGPHDEIAPEYNDYDWYVYDRYGGGIAYDSNYGWLRAEYMAGHTFGYRAEGAYGSIGAKIGPKWAVGARYDYFNANSREPGHIQHYISGAVNWQPWKHLRVQLNYMYKIDPGQTPVHLVNLMTSISL